MKTLIAVTLLVTGLCAQPVQPPPAPNPATQKARPDLFESGVAAMVNREVITVAEVRDVIRGKAAGLKPPQREQLYQDHLSRMILDRVMDQATERLQLTLNPSHILAHIEQTKENLGGEEGYRKWLIERGTTAQDYQTDITKQSQRHLYVRAFAGGQSIGDRLRPEHSVEPTAREIRQYYERHLEGEFSAVAKAEIWYMAVTLASVASRVEPGTKEKALPRAKQIVAELRTGADFATLAKRYDVLSSDTGGYAGWHDAKSTLNPLILEPGFNAKIDEISDPIEFRRGYLIVKVSARKEARTVPFSEAQTGIRKQIKDERVQRAMSAVRQRIVREAYIWPAAFKRRLILALRPPPAAR
ncbi:MAG: hypothetical protein CMJ83_06220 [Planctomycetes bacterium]|nr:hypothetical protein [Planctomycetota bacterium]